jgi:hypothetical protein
VGAAIEQRCGGPRRHTPNSQAILAAGLRLYRAAIVACFVLWREFGSCGFWDFCNTIGTKRTWRDVCYESVMRAKADIDQDVFLRSHAKRDSKLTYLTALGMIDQPAADVSGVQAPDGAGAHLAWRAWVPVGAGIEPASASSAATITGII